MPRRCEASFELLRGRFHFAHGARDEGAVAHGGFGGDERGDVYRIGRLGLAHAGGKFAIDENAAEAEAGESGGF